MTAVDPITLAVIQGALSTIQLEMTSTLRLTGRSNIITIARDYSHAIFDSSNEMILQGEDIPIHLGSLMFAMKSVAEYFADDVYPGDVLYHNDPAYGGSHLPDMTMYKPVFIEDELAFWMVSKVHVVDAGGPVPTSYNIEATEIYAEGLRIPPLKLVDRGVERRDVINMILANIRTPEKQAGDMRAQLGALGVGERRLIELCERYGLATVRTATDELKRLAEQEMRALIRQVPDGTVVTRCQIEDTGHGLGELTIAARVTVAGDELTIALESPDQVPHFINSYEANTVSAVYLGLMMWAQLPPPYNEGMYRAVRVNAGRRGSLTNAVIPAPSVNSTTCPTESITDAVKEALTEAQARRPIAGWGHSFGFSIAGDDPRTGKPFINYLLAPIIAGAGAVDGLMDGWPVIGPANCIGGATCGDTELLEYGYPIIVHEYAIREDSGGAGRWRGGCGASMIVEPLATMSFIAWGEGTKYPAPGYGGAHSVLAERKVAHGVIERKGAEPERLQANRVFDLGPGDRYRSVNPGGGGCGDPLERDPARVADDVRNAKVSVEGAREEYGVVIDPISLALLERETDDLRRRVR
jgi:N-methylhydantoinase B